jgi:ABC-type Mn2+/Zn2+ transport system permease subunit
MGTLVSALGVYFSVLIDLPTGATIVCTFGLVLLSMCLVYTLVPGWRGSREIHGQQSATHV